MVMVCFAIVGFSMLLGSRNPHIQYVKTSQLSKAHL